MCGGTGVHSNSSCSRKCLWLEWVKFIIFIQRIKNLFNQMKACCLPHFFKSKNDKKKHKQTSKNISRLY